ncbi:DUF6744 family protein [Cytobacillus horneckiae]|uniref:Uncharacterized protein n=1 Tax=Cytobacillus horneckiae TaxID=549687 RepID=A0A2N0ZAY8_9BACI|nr:DUF6744 family protein [Cytobacillus horneckiae]MEC1158720.1 hypothetical protein [Cytobacillus horneckiae]NRG47624.1 hypothetical protein [Bacillus sp. CRN 9]PKG26670.1 hypothetical protein CWS20_22750 [Cytobacillus horneckiae]
MQIQKELKEKSIVAAKENQEGTIGNLFWYSIGNHLISREELETKFDDVGLDHNWLPNPIRISDAFRRATKEIQKRNMPTNDPKTFFNFLTREVYSDKNMIQRNIVVEKVDQSGKRLEYNPTASIILLNKKDSTISISVEDGEQETAAQALAEDAVKRYHKYSKFYGSQNLRVMVAKILASLAPTQVRPNGGVYFVPKTFENDLEQLSCLCNSLEQSEAFSIPLFDTKDNRGMVNKKLHEDMLSVLHNCDSLLFDNSKIDKSKIKEAISDAKRIADTFKTYQSVVSLDVEVLNKNLNELRERAVSLMKKMD